jgi:DNA-binding MarR family transcriptional regulator
MSMPRPDRERLIERFHHLAIRMLRSLRQVDEAGGLSGPRASVLAVLVFRGPMSLSELARAEGVKAPTMSRLVKSIAEEGLVRVRGSEADQRRLTIEATARGRRLMLAGRSRRLEALAEAFVSAGPAELLALAAVVAMMERAFAHPRTGHR